MTTQERDDGDGPCECEIEPVPGALWPMNEGDDGSWEIERCDLCARFEDDRAAADAVARVVGATVRVRTWNRQETYALAGFDAVAANRLRARLAKGRA